MDTQISTTGLMVIIGVIVLAVIIIFAFVSMRRRRTERLRSQFGDGEYARTVQKIGSRRRAEAELQNRKQRVAGFDIRPLSAGDRDHFKELWRNIQARFVDSPGAAVTEADQLIRDVMSKRGYPMGNFEERAGNISVHHPLVVENYRVAHDIAIRQVQGEANTEDLRQAMIHYRNLFDELVREQGEIKEKAAA